MATGAVGQGVAEVLEQGVAEAADTAQRRAQVVGHRVAEGLQLAAGGLGAVARPPQLVVGVLAHGDVADGAEDQGPEVDLDGELGAIAAQAAQLEPRTHRPHPRAVEVAAAVARVHGAEALGQERLHRLAEERPPRVPEQPLGLGIDQQHRALAVDHHHGVGRRLHEGPEVGVGRVHERHPSQ